MLTNHSSTRRRFVYISLDAALPGTLIVCNHGYQIFAVRSKGGVWKLLLFRQISTQNIIFHPISNSWVVILQMPKPSPIVRQNIQKRINNSAMPLRCLKAQTGIVCESNLPLFIHFSSPRGLLKVVRAR